LDSRAWSSIEFKRSLPIVKLKIYEPKWKLESFAEESDYFSAPLVWDDFRRDFSKIKPSTYFGHCFFKSFARFDAVTLKEYLGNSIESLSIFSYEFLSSSAPYFSKTVLNPSISFIGVFKVWITASELISKASREYPPSSTTAIRF